MIKKKGLTAFIVDDNADALDTLATDLRKMPEFGGVYTFSSYAEATLPLLEEQPDVLFLDVEMPDKTGLEFLESICPKVKFSFKVVFYSAFSKYMHDAIRYAAFDFLLKPYKKSELREVVDRLAQSGATTDFRQATFDNTPHKLAIQTISELLLLSAEQIILFNYCSKCRSWQVQLSNGSIQQLRRGTTAEDILTLHQSLARISSTCILNLNYLAAIENSTQRCRLCPPFDDIEITASRRYYSKLKERFELL